MTVNLLSSLGFVVNEDKSVFQPTHELQFLGFLVNSVTLCPCTPPKDKVKGIKKDCQRLIDNPSVSNRALSRLVRKLTLLFNSSSFPSPPSLLLPSEDQKRSSKEKTELRGNVVPRSGNAARAPLVEGPSCSLERQIPSEEEGRFYDRDRCVKAGLGRILQWGKIRGNLVPSRTPSAHQLPRPYGRCLIAIKSFCKNKASIQVKLLMDNTTAISYINKMEGSSPVLASLVYEIWQWCLQRKIYLSAQHIPGILNYAADQESRVYRDSSDWKLDPTVFACLNSLWGPLEMDLFATPLTNQLPRFVSWRPDP